MRYIKNLCFDSQKMLQIFYKKSKKHEVRQKAQCILLSSRGYSIGSLSTLFGVHFNTIYNWFNSWESQKLVSLYHAKGQGRKPKINASSQKIVAEMISENPKQIDKIVIALSERENIQVSKITIKRVLKKNFG